jgi:hypothetical protein
MLVQALTYLAFAAMVLGGLGALAYVVLFLIDVRKSAGGIYSTTASGQEKLNNRRMDWLIGISVVTLLFGVATRAGSHDVNLPFAVVTFILGVSGVLLGLYYRRVEGESKWRRIKVGLPLFGGAGFVYIGILAALVTFLG